MLLENQIRYLRKTMRKTTKWSYDGDEFRPITLLECHYVDIKEVMKELIVLENRCRYVNIRKYISIRYPH